MALNLEGGTIIAATMGIVSVCSGAVALYVRATRAELSIQIERTRAEVISHINSSYVRKENCALREEGIHHLLDLMRTEFRLGE